MPVPVPYISVVDKSSEYNVDVADRVKHRDIYWQRFIGSEYDPAID